MSSPFLAPVVAVASDAAAAPQRKKRVRKQKADAPTENAVLEQDTSDVVDAPATKRSKREVDESEEAVEESAAAEDAPMPDTDEADADQKPANGGGYLSQETLNYYKQLAAVLDKDDFENEEDKSMFLSNVVEELCGSDAGKVRATTRRGLAGEKEDPSAAASTSKSFVLQRLCSHAKCSHLVQKIMQIATPDQVAMFLTALQDNVVEVFSDRYGSHVLESVFFRLPALLAEEAAAVAAEESGQGDMSALAAKEAAQKVATSLSTRTAAAWRNVGTHSSGSVLASAPDATRTPLRAHFFRLIAAAVPEGQLLSLAQHAHAAFALRHAAHILAGETDIRALADADSGVKSSSSSSAATPAAAAAAWSATSAPSYLVGLEELLPWMVQEVSASAPDELEEAARSASAVPTLQVLLRSADRSAKLATGTGAEAARTHTKTLMAKLIQFRAADEDSWTPENTTQASKNIVFVLMCDRSGSRLLETLCSLGGADLVSPLFSCHMRGRLLELAQHQVGNFVLQDVLRSVRARWGSRGRHLLRDAYEELAPHLVDLCGASRTGVALQLLDACVRVRVKENRVFKLLAGLALGSVEDPTPITSNVVGALLLAPALKAPTADASAVSVIGSLIVQSCLQPGRGLQPADPNEKVLPEKEATALKNELAASQPFVTVLNAILALPQEFILSLALDHTGSHIFDALVAAPCHANVKQQVLRRFQMKWVDLALSPAGSYVLETLFAIAPPQLKVGIAGDLVRAEKRVLASRSGAVVHRKLRLEHYKRHQQSWLTQRDATRARAIFADMLDEKPAAEKKSTGGKAADKEEKEKKPRKAKTEETNEESS